MEVSRIIAEIDAQIAKLQQARELLAGIDTSVTKGRGRPRKQNATAERSNKRKLTPEGRKRISETMKRRWAERRKSLSKAAAAK